MRECVFCNLGVWKLLIQRLLLPSKLWTVWFSSSQFMSSSCFRLFWCLDVNCDCWTQWLWIWVPPQHLSPALAPSAFSLLCLNKEKQTKKTLLFSSDAPSPTSPSEGFVPAGLPSAAAASPHSSQHPQERLQGPNNKQVKPHTVKTRLSLENTHKTMSSAHILKTRLQHQTVCFSQQLQSTCCYSVSVFGCVVVCKCYNIII